MNTTVDEVEKTAESLRENFLAYVEEHRNALSPLPVAISARLEKIPDIRAVLFDVYGTLIISAAGEVGTAEQNGTSGPRNPAQHRAPFAYVLETAGFSIEKGAEKRAEALYFEGIRSVHEELSHSGIDYPEVNIASIWAELLDTLLSEGYIGTSLVGTSQEIEVDLPSVLTSAFLFEVSTNVVAPMPNALETIRRLKERGMYLGIVSNAQFYTPLVLEALFGSPLDHVGFSPALRGWSWKTGKAKPSTDLFTPPITYLNKKSAIEPHQILYIGNDIRNDIFPARSLGFKTVLFAGDERSLRLREDDERMKGVEPDAVITDLKQLSRIIQ